jgi:hypothetical protein
MALRFLPGQQALVKGSFEVVTVVAVSNTNVLVERAGGQTSFRPDELEDYCGDLCPLRQP